MIDKPAGIKVVALVLFFIGCGISAIVIYAITHRDIVVSLFGVGADLSDIAFRTAVILPLEAVIAFILSGGIWTMQDWARRGVILGSLYVLIKTAFQLAHRPAFEFPSTLGFLVVIEAAILLSIVFYLQLPSVLRNFKNDPE